MAETDKGIIAVGIDLGTTNSVVASHDGPQPRVLVNKDNKPQTRSVVGLKKKRGKAGSSETEVLIGDIAVRNWPMAPNDTIVSIKRLMGRAASDPEVQKIRESFQYDIVEPSDGTRDSVRVVMGGKEYSLVDISGRRWSAQGIGSAGGSPGTDAESIKRNPSRTVTQRKEFENAEQ